MSLIPYTSSDSQSVVLRHQQTLVVYDPHSRQLALYEAPAPLAPPETVEYQNCPFCKRPLSDDSHRDDSSPDRSTAGITHRRGSTTMAESGFVDQEYFRMLESSVPVSGAPPARMPPPSPTRRRLPRPSGGEEIEGKVGSRGTDGTPGHPSAGGGISSAAFSPKYFERFFVTERELGRGGTGVVLLVRHLLDGVSLGNFACKRVPVGDNHKWLEKVLLEVQTLQRLSHNNLVSYRHVWLENVHLTTFGPSVPCAFILQQYCNSGDLHNYVLGSTKQKTKEQLKDQMRRRTRGELELPQNQPRKLSFEQIISFFIDIASGLSYLHSNGFIHRDLKPSNCLLNDTGVPGQELMVLVSDFGEVQMESASRKSTGATGTISYCAPEVLRREPGGGYGNFTTKSDIFSLGMILHFMCFGRLPYAGADMVNEENENLDSLREEIIGWKGFDESTRLRPDLPDRLYQSLRTLISPNPSVRPSADEILKSIGLEEGTPLVGGYSRRGSSSSQKKPIPLDDQKGFLRISPIADTPPPSTPVASPTASTYRNYDTFKKLPRLTHLARQLPKRASRLGASPKPPETVPSTSANTPQASHDPESSIILRPRMEAVKSPTGLLGIMTWGVQARLWLARFQWISALKFIVFLLKVVTLASPCSPLTVNPWVYYPLLCMAALDLAMPLLVVTFILLVVHVAVLLLVNTFGSVCMLDPT